MGVVSVLYMDIRVNSENDCVFFLFRLENSVLCNVLIFAKDFNNLPQMG